MKLYPIFASLSQRAVLVVGGGAVAERKVAALLEAQAQVTVNAGTLTPRLQQWARQGRIAHRSDPFQESWLERVWLVVAATYDRDMKTLVATLAVQLVLQITLVLLARSAGVTAAVFARGSAEVLLRRPSFPQGATLDLVTLAVVACGVAYLLWPRSTTRPV